jgi:hypothetical protein
MTLKPIFRQSSFYYVQWQAVRDQGKVSRQNFMPLDKVFGVTQRNRISKGLVFSRFNLFAANPP